MNFMYFLTHMRKNSVFTDIRLWVAHRFLVPLFCVLVLFYLAFHSVSGERGVVALFKEDRNLELLKAELEQVRSEREALESKVHRLSSNSLDLDLLDEQARRVLGLAGKNEVVIFTDSN